MPYFISDSNPDCAGWAVEKEDGEVIGCHQTKQDAIDQMVAVSIAEEMEPGGERALPDNYRPALAEDVPEGRACGNCVFYDESRQNAEGTKAWCDKWDDFVDGGYYCNAWQPHAEMGHEEEEEVYEDEDEQEMDVSVRVVDLSLPEYIKSAARKGLTYYGQKLAGAGIVASTVREARDMARGEITEDKVIRANAWAARHMVDLDAAKNSNADDKEFPGAGAVAFYLWGINPLNPEPAMDWFARKAEQIKDERADAPAPKKDQIVGSDKNAPGSADSPAGAGTIELSEAIENGLQNKVDEHNDNVGDNPGKRATIGMLRAVFRRGAGAYSTSHRPGMTRDQWAYARVNAFLYLLRNGRPENDAYVGDNDLLPKDHPRSSRSLGGFVANVYGMAEQVETRRITFNDFELRAAPEGNGMTFSGYAAVFNSDSEPLPFIERIMPGAFAKSLKSRNNIRMYMNHDSSMLLATTRAKTMRLVEDSKGLFVEADLPDTTVGRDLSVLMQRKDVDSMSFGFTVPQGGDRWSDDGMTRELRQIKLYEVSVVTGFPAYAATSAQVRSFDALATRTGIDADQLAVAITTLEAGQTLDPSHAALLRETVAKLEPQPESAPASVGVLAKHLELLKNF
jgi:HK97 family phage prohead protease